MIGLTTQNFVSAATGIAYWHRAHSRVSRAPRRRPSAISGSISPAATLYVLMPICDRRLRSFLVWQGMPQNLGAYVDATTLEGAKQTHRQGPAASQIAIKQLGTNGGGFWNANSAVPYREPDARCQQFPRSALDHADLGRAHTYLRPHGRKTSGRAGRSMPPCRSSVLRRRVRLLLGRSARHAAHSTRSGSSGGNMEGKEVRFGIANSSLWAVATTAASNGSVNAMHDSFTPLGGMIPMVNIMLGEIMFGGVGSGLYGMLLYRHYRDVHRRPDGRPHAGIPRQEDRGEGGQDGDARHPDLAADRCSAGLPWLRLIPAALPASANAGPHGFSRDALPAMSSQTGNNGSAFAGLTGNTLWYNTTGGLAMLIGRLPRHRSRDGDGWLAGRQEIVPPSAGTFPTHGGLFVGLLVGVIVIIGGLIYFPALALGPIVEQFAMQAGTVF